MRRVLILVLLVLLFAFPAPAFADVAPPSNPPGSNLQPGEELTQVRMAAETVLIDVQANTPVDSLGQARVTADFTMHNTGAEAESMAVRFPISANNGFFDYPELQDLVVQVDGRTVATRPTTGPDPVYGGEEVPWAEFDVTFPPGEDLPIRVSYTLEGTGEYPYIAFYYILATGAGWKDSIGDAEIILRLPYEANQHNVIEETQIGWAETTPGAVMSGRELRWHFQDLEPTQENNVEVALVMPSVWKQVLTEQANLAANPVDGEAWGRLGKLYKEITFLRKDYRHDPGGLDLYNQAIHAYQQAVDLLPNDALWHAGYADLLAFHASWGYYTHEGSPLEVLSALGQIHTALVLNPDDPQVQEIALTVYFELGQPDYEGAMERRDDGSFDFPWLTATPTTRPTETDVPAATATSAPIARAATPTAPPADSGFPLCGSVILLPMALLLAARRRRS